MAKYEKIIKGDFGSVVNAIDEKILNSAMSMNLVDESNYVCGETLVAIRVYDKYFMRNGNRASLTLTIVGNDSEVFISAIGAGGGSGVIFNFSLGAELDMVNIVESAVNELN
ncbi:DUF6054 family protein [Clostridium sp. 'White wine YQ']|uniref:DUF6054 family protein n=1 Tax=Clostridium sp. 'White wine YQ' TaxID=3027474 RepID=UPI0023666926|nr:DUF6054 family protein [Clostridium sp. 'White wine YQ']MDD7795009.1 DUF6054 family protein [Clostridium sp. 'White wine YQ']